VALAATAMLLPGPSAAAPPGSFSFGVAGDFAYGSASQSTMAVAGGAGLDFFLVTGDTTYGQTNESNWCNAFHAQVPKVILTAGNHDTGENSGADLDTIMAACPYNLTEPMTGNYGREYYFDYPASGPLARFILTGCGNVFNPANGSTWACSSGDAHYNFVSDAIDAARTAQIPWVIVGMHKVCITTATKLCEIGTDFFNLLLDKNVDLILQAHDHQYQRSKQLTCATPNMYRPECVADDGVDGYYMKGSGSVVVIQGTGGASRYGLNPSDSEAGYFAASFDDTYGFVKYTLNATEVSVRFLRSAAGASTDSFTIGPQPPDTTPPAIAFTAPLEGAVTNQSTVWLSGHTEPRARVSINGAEATVGPTGNFGLMLALHPGPNLIVATAWDEAGNSANATLNVTFQDPVPVLEAQLAQARAELGEAQANLSAAQIRVDALDAELNATQAQLAAAEVDLAAAETGLATAQLNLAALQADANTTQEQLDAAQVDLNTAEATLAATQASLASTQARVTALQSDANDTQADLEAARQNVTLALYRVSALEVDATDARAQQNATQAELASAKARADAAASQASQALMVGGLGVALAAVSALLALRGKGKSKSNEEEAPSGFSSSRGPRPPTN
jgi:hypothetical protein